VTASRCCALSSASGSGGLEGGGEYCMAFGAAVY
jgi:hypothetical protein